MLLENLEKLYQGEGYRRGQSTFPDTSTLIDPWMSKVRPFADSYKISVQSPSEIAVSDVGGSEEVEHVIYSRVLLEAVLKDEFQINVEGTQHKKVFGLLYSLDVNNPICKTYSGYEFQACLNLQVFNPASIVTKLFTDPDFDSIYRAPDEFVNRIDAEKQEFHEAYTFLHSTSYQGSELDELLGRLARKCVTTTGMMTPYTNMVKMLQNRSDVSSIRNIYYQEDMNYVPWTIYQSLTSTLCKRPDFAMKPDRVLKAYQLFQEPINFN